MSNPSQDQDRDRKIQELEWRVKRLEEALIDESVTIYPQHLDFVGDISLLQELAQHGNVSGDVIISPEVSKRIVELTVKNSPGESQ